MNQPTFRLFSGSADAWNHWLDDFSGASPYQYHPFANGRDRRFQVVREDVSIAGGVLLSGRMLGWPRRILGVHRGPFGDIGAALDVLEERARTEGAWCLEVMPDVPPDDVLRATFAERGWEAIGATRHTLRLDLAADHDALLAGFGWRARDRLKRAQRDGILVRAANGTADRAAFCRLIDEMSTDKNLGRAPDEHYLRLSDYLLTHPSRGIVLIAERNGEALGSLMLWRSAHRVEYLYGASRRDKGSVGYPLQWAGIRWAKTVGASEYDFGGYNPSLSGGPAFLKRAFCRNVVELSPPWRKTFRPMVYGAAQRVRGWLAR